MMIVDVKVELKREIEVSFVSVGVGILVREGEEVVEVYFVVRYVNFV